VSEPDRGCSDACAKGLARTSADLLGVMNADDFFAQGAFAKLLTLRLAQPRHVFWGGASPELDLAGNQIKLKQPYVRDHRAIGHWEVGMWSFGVGCLFDGAAYRAVGGFDPRFRQSNDVDLWIRMGKLGTFTFTPETVAFVHHNPQSVARRDDLGNDIALIASNYLHGNDKIARAILARYIARWAKSLNTKEPLDPKAARDTLALVPPGILAQALVLRLARALRRRLRRISSRRF
jgi:hypothetical protein